MTDARRHAWARAALIAAIQRLGGNATTTEIRGESGLPLSSVRQRLARNGPSELLVGHQYFTRKGESWG